MAGASTVAHPDFVQLRPANPPSPPPSASPASSASSAVGGGPDALSPSPPLCPRTAPPDCLRTVLTSWDQTSLRSYMRVALCFAFDDTRRADAVSHLRLSLARLARQRPDFAGRLEVGPLGARQGIVFLRTSPDGEIPLCAVDISRDFAYPSYAELRAADFPPSAFVHERFAAPGPLAEGCRPTPVAVLTAFFIRGGLLISVFLSHSIGDGECLRMFLESVAGQTRGEPVDFPSELTAHVPPPISEHSPTTPPGVLGAPALRLVPPEYALLDEPIGPTVPRPRPGGVPASLIRKTGRTFVFSNDRLAKLRARLQASGDSARAHSNYTALAALAWVHVARARLADVEYVPRGNGCDAERATLQTMVNWKNRAYQATSQDYFGNATVVALTRLPTSDLVAACTDPAQLARVAGAVEATIRGVDEEFVQRRTALFDAVADPRYVGLDFDPRTPQDLGFNTWRYFGADTQWVLPGIATSTPDAVRRTQDEWNMSGSLILPAKADSAVHELLVTLPRTSMELLCRDAEWMAWVDKVVA